MAQRGYEGWVKVHVVCIAMTIVDDDDDGDDDDGGINVGVPQRRCQGFRHSLFGVRFRFSAAGAGA